MKRGIQGHGGGEFRAAEDPIANRVPSFTNAGRCYEGWAGSRPKMLWRMSSFIGENPPSLTPPAPRAVSIDNGTETKRDVRTVSPPFLSFLPDTNRFVFYIEILTSAVGEKRGMWGQTTTFLPNKLKPYRKPEIPNWLL